MTEIGGDGDGVGSVPVLAVVTGSAACAPSAGAAGIVGASGDSPDHESLALVGEAEAGEAEIVGDILYFASLDSCTSYSYLVVEEVDIC